jgi:hypothetical protein
MSTASQSLINPQNAKSSTGPSSPAAKSVSTKPASKFALLPYESREEYDETLADYRRCFAPTDAHEEFLVARMVQSKWELTRIQGMQAELVAQMMAADPEHKTPSAAIAAALLAGKAKPYLTLQRQAAAAERGYFQAHRQLERGRKPRKSDASTDLLIRAFTDPPIAVPAPKTPAQPVKKELKLPDFPVAAKPEVPYFAAAPRPHVANPFEKFLIR